MRACFCTGACSRTGQCPNTVTVPVGYPPYQPYRPSPPALPAVIPTPPTIIVQPGPTEERIREIIREELKRGKEGQ